MMMFNLVSYLFIFIMFNYLKKNRKKKPKMAQKQFKCVTDTKIT